MSVPRAVQAFYARIWNAGDLQAVPALLTPDIAFRGSLGPQMRGHAAFMAYVRAVRSALADYRCDIEACVAEGDQAFARLRFSGRHVGDFHGYPPTGKPVSWQGAALFRLRGEQIAGLWVLGDLAGLEAGLRDNAGAATPPGPDAQVRRARSEDREPLLDLWERSVRATHGFLTDGDVAALRPLVRQALASEALAWWVLASPTAGLVGFLGQAGDTVEALFIDPAHHRRGAGRRLMAHARSLATGPLAVDVNEQNQGALAFYQALGFAVVGRSPTDSGGRPFPILHLRQEPPPRP